MTRPTNLLFLFTDEQRADTMAAYGNRRIQTPNLNGLARQSLVFERAYATQPLCTPARSSILTGLWPHANGCTENNVPLRPATRCLPEMLPPGRYATGYYGKWHLGDEVFAQHGFDGWRSTEDGYRKYYSPDRDRAARSTYHQFLLDSGFRPDGDQAFTRSQAARLPEEFSKPAYLAWEASRFLREHRREPFVLFVSFLEPHMPFYGPRDDQHDPAGVALPANFANPPTADQHPKLRLFHQHYRQKGCGGSDPLSDEAAWRRLIARYWGLCSQVDTHLGLILATLEDCGLADHTVVVYSSDHGDMMGSHQLVAKCVMFEEAVRVPLLIRLPGQTDGRRIAAPVSQVDLPATLLDLLGCEVPDGQQGRSLRRLLEDPQAEGDDVFIEWNGPNCGLAADVVGNVELPEHLARYCTAEEAAAAIRDPIRTIVTPGGWKFSCSPLGCHELYNLGDDPLETTNLAPRTEHKRRMAELAARLRAWQERTGDAVKLPESF
jgi:arylsulfatase A-like enzyme